MGWTPRSAARFHRAGRLHPCRTQGTPRCRLAKSSVTRAAMSRAAGHTGATVASRLGTLPPANVITSKTTHYRTSRLACYRRTRTTASHRQEQHDRHDTARQTSKTPPPLNRISPPYVKKKKPPSRQTFDSTLREFALPSVPPRNLESLHRVGSRGVLALCRRSGRRVWCVRRAG